jgi:hypothetical protein
VGRLDSHEERTSYPSTSKTNPRQVFQNAMKVVLHSPEVKERYGHPIRGHVTLQPKEKNPRAIVDLPRATAALVDRMPFLSPLTE